MDYDDQVELLYQLTEGLNIASAVALLEDGAALAAAGVTNQDAVESLYYDFSRELEAKYSEVIGGCHEAGC